MGRFEVTKGNTGILESASILSRSRSRYLSVDCCSPLGRLIVGSGYRRADLRLPRDLTVLSNFLETHGFAIAICCEDAREFVLLCRKAPDNLVGRNRGLVARRPRPGRDAHNVRRLRPCLRSRWLLRGKRQRRRNLCRPPLSRRRRLGYACTSCLFKMPQSSVGVYSTHLEDCGFLDTCPCIHGNFSRVLISSYISSDKIAFYGCRLCKGKEMRSGFLFRARCKASAIVILP